MLSKKKYIIGVSGGPDSMALLNEYKRKIVAVCHVNYAKRISANRDQKIVENYCLAHNISLYTLLVTDYKMFEKKYNEKNFQVLARKIRYGYFEEVAHKVNCFNLLIAHNLDDFLETALYQLDKNVNTLFFGIKQKSMYNDLTIYRPFINIRKKTLQRSCDQNKIEYGIDESNFSPTYSRNIIRKQISNWSDEKFLNFRHSVYVLNKKLKIDRRKCEKNFKKWKNINFDILFFLKFDQNMRIHLLYEWAKENKILIRSKKKLLLIDSFLTKINQSKKLRISNNAVVCLKKNKILVNWNV